MPCLPWPRPSATLAASRVEAGLRLAWAERRQISWLVCRVKRPNCKASSKPRANYEPAGLTPAHPHQGQPLKVVCPLQYPPATRADASAGCGEGQTRSGRRAASRLRAAGLLPSGLFTPPFTDSDARWWQRGSSRRALAGFGRAQIRDCAPRFAFGFAAAPLKNRLIITVFCSSFFFCCPAAPADAHRLAHLVLRAERRQATTSSPLLFPSSSLIGRATPHRVWKCRNGAGWLTAAAPLLAPAVAPARLAQRHVGIM